MLSEKKKYLPWFILKETPFLGDRSICRLIRQFHTPEAVLECSPDELRQVKGITRQAIWGLSQQKNNRRLALAKLERILQKQIALVVLTDSHYPILLKEIHDPPPILSYVGSLESYGTITPCIAIVGSRNPTSYGISTAKQLAHALTKSGFAVVSGMARGIDTAAHEGALAGRGKTIAVLGSGFNHIYPRENQKLFSQIRENGAVISEFDLDTPPLGYHFPIRNRIIAGMSTGTVVVEAEKKSGSLITARLAGEYNREVFAVPGSIKSRKSQGPHALLKSGAKLIENDMDIIEELHHFIHVVPKSAKKDQKKNKEFPCLNEAQSLIYDLLNQYPIHADVIIEASGMQSSIVNATLLDLELKGLVNRHPGNYFTISEE